MIVGRDDELLKFLDTYGYLGTVFQLVLQCVAESIADLDRLRNEVP